VLKVVRTFSGKHLDTSKAASQDSYYLYKDLSEGRRCGNQLKYWGTTSGKAGVGGRIAEEVELEGAGSVKIGALKGGGQRC